MFYFLGILRLISVVSLFEDLFLMVFETLKQRLCSWVIYFLACMDLNVYFIFPETADSSCLVNIRIF